MADTKLAISSVLSTVADTAKAVSGVVNTVSGTLDMVNNSVRHMQAKQRFDHTLDMAVYKDTRIEEIAAETAQRKKTISDLLKDPELETYYNETYAKLVTLTNGN